MSTKNTEIKVIGIASGIAAQQYGAQLGVWDIYYSMPNIITAPNVMPMQVYYSNSNSSKLNVIKPLSALYKQINAEVVESHKNNNKYLFITGDHSGAVATWGSMSNATNSEIGLIWIDAHLDSHTPDTSDSKNVHGMPVAHLMGFGDKLLSNLIERKIKPENFCFIGTRDYEQAEIDFITKHGIKAYFMKDINKDNVESVFKEAIERVSKNTEHFGISLDIDSMDPTCAPGTGCYNPGGLFAEDICKSLHNIYANPKFIALEITEYNPLLDKERKTFNVVTSIIKAALNVK